MMSSEGRSRERLGRVAGGRDLDIAERYCGRSTRGGVGGRDLDGGGRFGEMSARGEIEAAGGRDLSGGGSSGGRSASFRVEASRRQAESTPVEAPPPNPASPDTSAVLPRGNLGLQGINLTSGGPLYHDSTSLLANQEMF